MLRQGGSAVLAAAVLIAAAAGSGCGSSGDKAGGGSAEGEPPLVLRLESEDDLQVSGAPEFAAAVARLSHGSMRIKLVPGGHGNEIDSERSVVEDVRAGTAQLGIVGVRVWDRLGVKSFRALLAPLLVDSLELQQRVLATSLPARMLEGVDRAGVVGIAVLPGPLRMPLGLSRAFVGPGDYRGATLGLRPGGVAAATFRALGARARAYVPGDLSGLDGAELDPTTIGYNGLDQRRGWLTTNVVLWPKPYSIVMNARAFAALTPEQQELLRRAGRDAARPEQRQIARDEATALTRACAAARISFVTASAGELDALRRAVQPVYDELERDPNTRRSIEEIGDMRGGGSANAAAGVRCPRAASRIPSAPALEGTWRYAKATRQDLIAAGVDPKNAEALSRLPATSALVFGLDGRHKGIDLETGKVLSTGTYEVEGNIIRLVFESGVAVDLGRVYTLRWSVYRDRLTFDAVPGSEPLIALVLRPWNRAR